MPKKTVVFIMGTAHCGSTLLTYVLGSHSDCLALGEVSNLPEAYRNNKRMCAVCEDGCKFWNRQFSATELSMISDGFAEHRLHKHIPLKLEKAVRGALKVDQVFNPYSLIASKVEESVLIDSTKTVYWLEKKLAAREFKDNLVNAKLIHLIRDGRAVMASYGRRKVYQGLSAQQFGKQFGTLWKDRLTNEHAFFDGFSGSKLRLRYEEFATQPAQQAQQLCDWIGIEYQPDMLNYWKHEHHNISGNAGTRTAIKNYQTDLKVPNNSEEKAPSTAKQFAPPKDSTPLGIRLKTSWTEKLSEEHIAAFYEASDHMNQAYEWQ